jgi:UDP-GlcNAc3NAcA epimerase
MADQRISADGGAIRMLTIVGARPQFVKAAAVSRAVAARESIEEVLVHTGQHFDANMSDIFFEEMGIPHPKHRLDIHGGGHGEMTGRMMIALESVLQAEAPDVVLVYGDTNSTLAGALCAAKLHIPIAHVEAGVRSFDRTMPEEVNRVLVDAIGDLLFAPTQAGVQNLQGEAVRGRVLKVGDVNYDATRMLTALALERSDVTRKLGLDPGGFSVATVHRAAVVDDRGALEEAISYLRAQAAELPMVLPAHPRTARALARWNISTAGIQVIDPVGPLDMHRLLHDCATVFTDSGGLQKEAYFHRKPCVTLRDSTEWVETVECGWNRLWRGPDYAPRREIGDYGSGNAADAILDAVTVHLGKGRA